MPKCRTTDNIHNKLSADDRELLGRLFNDCFNRRDWPPMQKRLEHGPTDTNLVSQKKRVQNPPIHWLINYTLLPKKSHFCLKTVSH